MFLEQNLEEFDSEIAKIIQQETTRQQNCLELIASENFTMPAVLQAQGSVLTNKYAEGYPARRYYGGCERVDEAEQLAISRAKKLFGCDYANVQPHSGSQANQAVFLALLKPGDLIMGMSMQSGGHLTHGAAPNLSGKWFDSVSYDVDPKSFELDYNQIEAIALKHKPKLIIAGYSCYPRKLDFKKFRQIADKVGAWLLVDMCHIAGLVATGHHQSPFPHAHVVTSTTHKSLRGPRGGIILTCEKKLAKKIDSALFPGLQGGPLMHVIAAKAVGFKQNLSPEFKEYISDVVAGAGALAKGLIDRGQDVLTGGTDNHMVVLDLRSAGLTGKYVQDCLDRAGITCNKNAIPFDETSPRITSGIRLGTPACTSRGFKTPQWQKVAHLIANVLDCLASSKDPQHIDKFLQETNQQVVNLTSKFPLPY